MNEWSTVMKMCDAAESNPDLRRELRKIWPKIEQFHVPDDDPRVGLRGQLGLMAAETIPRHRIVCPYQVQLPLE